MPPSIKLFFSVLSGFNFLENLLKINFLVTGKIIKKPIISKKDKLGLTFQEIKKLI